MTVITSSKGYYLSKYKILFTLNTVGSKFKLLISNVRANHFMIKHTKTKEWFNYF